MTLYEFNILSFEEKQAVVWSDADFIDNYTPSFGEIEYCSLYGIDKFYVELVYNPRVNKLTDIKSFKTSKELEKYLPEIDTII